jgi:NAD(P)-dependent dehydrogenase (short-subunit alcohol dehydrogenase family)
MKHVVITGASRGLGRAMAIGFAADGWTLSGCGTETAALQVLAHELGKDHLTQTSEVTDSTAVEAFADAATKWGIEGLTAALAQERPNGLAAVALNPGIIETQMLRSCFGEEASSYPTPEEWAKVAVPYLALLGTRHNGKALTVPGM